MHGLESRGGSGSDDEATQDFWVWPLPEAGDITLVCEWPAYGIPESSAKLEGQFLRDAASRSRPVWTDEPTSTHLSHHGMMQGWSSGIGRSVRAAPNEEDTETSPDTPEGDR